MIRERLILRALKGETVQRPPVWMMRQADIYQNLSLCVINDFFTRCQTQS
jgi:uroporphyrinogen decarboxylase